MNSPLYPYISSPQLTENTPSRPPNYKLHNTVNDNNKTLIFLVLPNYNHCLLLLVFHNSFSPEENTFDNSSNSSLLHNIWQ